MDPHAVLFKTPRGVEELNRRDHDLPRTLRNALILVDGHSMVVELEKKGAIIPDFMAALRELIARGLVAPRAQGAHATPASVPSAAAHPDASGTSLLLALVGLAESILGERSGKVVKKLEEAGASREQLAAAIEACFKLIRLTIDEAQADEFRSAAREVLSRGD